MEEFISRLRENGLKITPKREAIIGVFKKTTRSLSPEEVFVRIKKRFGRASFPSVYRNLEAMHALGILFKVDKTDRRLYYGLCRHKQGVHHHHIICSACGKIEEFQGCGVPLKKKTVKGFKITGHILQLDGICPACLRHDSKTHK